MDQSLFIGGERGGGGGGGGYVGDHMVFRENGGNQSSLTEYKRGL